ncbi:hypothetical protein C2845_PM11G11550 [Panicum miliaceum]|uniref:Uncharacterized protein n=1 Tax=Panicum miliaceum TaxID=4540 RepID=A0A3L6RPW1_PANMI|nr:hypothetical protein C2845_PM11G11550 [Panicum miliaceum]
MRLLGPTAAAFPQGKRWSRLERFCTTLRCKRSQGPPRSAGSTSWPALWGRHVSSWGLRVLERRLGAPPEEATGDHPLRRGRP